MLLLRSCRATDMALLCYCSTGIYFYMSNAGYEWSLQLIISVAADQTKPNSTEQRHTSPALALPYFTLPYSILPCPTLPNPIESPLSHDNAGDQYCLNSNDCQALLVYLENKNHDQEEHRSMSPVPCRTYWPHTAQGHAAARVCPSRTRVRPAAWIPKINK